MASASIERPREPRAKAAPPAPTPAKAPASRPEPTPEAEPIPVAAATPAEQPAPALATAGASSGDVAELRAHWAEVVDRASPVIKPLLKECRPIARDGARLTLAFPEGRDFMRSRITQRAPQIEALLTDMFGGSFAIECVATNLELEPLTVEEAVGAPADDPDGQALIDNVLKITGGQLVDAPEVR
jgi:hypothetical protein